MSTPVPKIILPKLAVAERQLDTAIWLWFHGGDVVSIIQLVDAAGGVLDDLLFHHKRKRPILFRPELMAGRTPRDVRPLITGAADFAKHARNDPETAYEYSRVFAAHYIYNAIAARDELMGDDLDDTHECLRGIFTLWYGLNHTENFDTRLGSFKNSYEALRAQGLTELSPIEFLEKIGKRFVRNPPRPD